MKESGDVYIEYKYLKDGIIKAQQRAEFFYNKAQSLESSEYNLIIPLLILSFEESSKSIHLKKDYHSGKRRGLTKIEWQRFSKHLFKLTDTEKQYKEKLENSTNSEFNRQKLLVELMNLPGVTQNKQQSIQVKQSEIELQSRFSKIKESCFYVDWNNQKKKWVSLFDIPEKDLEKIVKFLFLYCKMKLLVAKFFVWIIENPIQTSAIPNLLSGDRNKITVDMLSHWNSSPAKNEMDEYAPFLIKNMNDLKKGLDTINKYFSQ